MRRTLEMQADRIEAVLASHRVGGYVSGASVLGRLTQFELVTPLHTRIGRVSGLAEEIALSLGARSARVFREGSQLKIEVAHEGRNSRVDLLPLCALLAENHSLTAVLGADDQRSPLMLRLPAPDVTHVLIAGTTGSGKTALARSVLASLAMFNRPATMQFVLIDPKGRGFGTLAGLPHLLRPMVSDVRDAINTLEEIVAEMERRDHLARDTRRPVDTPRIVVAVDELADLIQSGGRPVEQMLSRLAQRGREAGVHLICCTQKPTSSAVGPILKANFPVRLVGSVTSPEEAKIATGIAGSGAEKLVGAGDFMLVTKGQTVRFQAAWVDQAVLAKLVTAIANGRQPSRRWSMEEVRKIQGNLRVGDLRALEGGVS